MSLSLDEVRKVANLARLSLTPDEEQKLQGDLSAILEAVDQLRTLDTAGVEPTAYATFAEGALREDEPHTSLGPERATQMAPSTSGTSFAVPKIIE